MPTDEELEKELEFSYTELRGDARATAAAGLAIVRAVRKFDKSSKWLGIVMATMTGALVVLTIVLVCLTRKLVP